MFKILGYSQLIPGTFNSKKEKRNKFLPTFPICQAMLPETHMFSGLNNMHGNELITQLTDIALPVTADLVNNKHLMGGWSRVS